MKESIIYNGSNLGDVIISLHLEKKNLGYLNTDNKRQYHWLAMDCGNIRLANGQMIVINEGIYSVRGEEILLKEYIEEKINAEIKEAEVQYKNLHEKYPDIFPLTLEDFKKQIENKYEPDKI